MLSNTIKNYSNKCCFLIQKQNKKQNEIIDTNVERRKEDFDFVTRFIQC